MVKPWRRVGADLHSQHRIFDLQHERYLSPRTGAAHDVVVLECADWANIIALTDADEVVMIRQFRFGIDALTLEIPGGIVDPGETPLQAAQRELREETGYVARRWTELGAIHPNPAFQRNRLHAFLAEGAQLRDAQALDAMEDIAVELRPLSDVDRMIATGELTHALVAHAFHRLDLLRRGHPPTP